MSLNGCIGIVVEVVVNLVLIHRVNRAENFFIYSDCFLAACQVVVVKFL